MLEGQDYSSRHGDLGSIQTSGLKIRKALKIKVDKSLTQPLLSLKGFVITAVLFAINHFLLISLTGTNSESIPPDFRIAHILSTGEKM